MAFTAKLGTETHDMQISGGIPVYTSGDNELVQRIKIALWHYKGEYFLDSASGVPWYSRIEGQRTNAGAVSSELRRAVLKVPGVERILEFSSVMGDNLAWQVQGKVLTTNGTTVEFNDKSN